MPQHMILAPAALICAVLVLPSLPAFIRIRSIPLISLSLWLFTTTTIAGINAWLWADNDDIKAILWCDISTKIMVGFPFAVPGATLCIIRQLERIISHRQPFPSKRLQGEIIFEAFLCLELPLIFIALHYINQGHRFDIYETIGCQFAYYPTFAFFLLVVAPTFTIHLGNLTYGGLIVYHLIQQHITLKTCLPQTPGSIPLASYVRLLSLCTIVLVCESAFYICLLYYDANLGIQEQAFSNESSNIVRWPRLLLTDSIYNTMVVVWWVYPTSCIFFFLCLGTGREPVKDYLFVMNGARGVIWQRIRKHKRADSSSPLIPTHITRDPNLESGSFSGTLSVARNEALQGLQIPRPIIRLNMKKVADSGFFVTCSPISDISDPMLSRQITLGGDSDSLASISYSSDSMD